MVKLENRLIILLRLTRYMSKNSSIPIKKKKIESLQLRSGFSFKVVKLLLFTFFNTECTDVNSEDLTELFLFKVTI